MNTKVVYVVVSVPTDIYLEQTWVSMWSLKHYNPEAHVTLVMDNDTHQNICDNVNRRGIFEFVDEIICLPFEKGVSGKERSRIIKTTLRQIIKGDFLFIDSDTIVTNSLKEVDSFNCHIGMVYDLHCKLSEYPFENLIRRESRYLYGQKLQAEVDQFNSGVIYAKDDEEAHDFYNKWKENWQRVKQMTNFRDQPSLIKTCEEMPHVVEPLSGVYNCQIVISIAYLYDAKIIHFFNNTWKKSCISPFLSQNFYLEIKKSGSIVESQKEMILNCKSAFYTPTMPVTMEEVQLSRSDLYLTILKIYQSHKLLFNLFDWLFGIGRRSRKIPALLKHICNKK